MHIIVLKKIFFIHFCTWLYTIDCPADHFSWIPGPTQELYIAAQLGPKIILKIWPTLNEYSFALNIFILIKSGPVRLGPNIYNKSSTQVFIMKLGPAKTIKNLENFLSCSKYILFKGRVFSLKDQISQVQFLIKFENVLMY